MTRTVEEALQILRYELNFLEQGGFERAAERKSTASPFRDSMTCLNYRDPLRPHACRECVLFRFVPEQAQAEDVPCHYIPLDENGRSIASVVREGRKGELAAALKTWLRRTIAALEEEEHKNECCV